MPSRVFASVFGPLPQREPGAQVWLSDREPSPPRLPDGVQTSLTRELYHQWHVEQEKWHHTQAQCEALLESTLSWFEGDLQERLSRTMPSAADQRRNELLILYADSLPNEYCIYVMTQILVGFGRTIVGIGERPSRYAEVPFSLQQLQHQELQKLYAMLARLQNLGLDGDRLARAYASATDTLIHFYAKAFISSASTISDEGRKESDYDWSDLEEHFIMDFCWGLAEMMRPVRTLRANFLALNPDNLARQPFRENWDPLRNEPGIKRILELGHVKAVTLMARDLYDSIEGEVITIGANFTDDAHREALETADKRQIITERLSKDIQERLLQPEVSTVNIIDFYVKLINQVGDIDESGLLLDSVSGRLRRFLRSRDDAVRIVVTSLLEPAINDDRDGEAVDSTEDYSGQVARLMQNYINEASSSGHRGEFWPGKDLTDPNWTPAPLGSGTGFYKTKYQDAMGHMITLKEQEVFAEELRMILQERLLQTDAEHFDKEERLVMMFKLRFSDLSIVQCEIMLKDMQDSRKIHKDTSTRIRDLQAKILSRSTWPDSEEITFNIPAAMQAQTDRFSQYYARLKPARRLKWQLARGKVEIELHFEDRTFKEEVTAAQAAVINEFAEQDDPDLMQEDRTTRTCAQLTAALDMDDALLRSCLSFWVSKRILLEHAPAFTSYSVIESLETLADDMLPNQADAQDAAVEAAQAAQEEPEEELLTALEQMNADKDMIYGPIRNMLSTQGAMATMNMYMFMKMVAADGFPYEEEDLVEFLKGLEEEELVVSAGGMWQLPEGEEDDE